MKSAKDFMETEEGLAFAKDALKVDSDWSALEVAKTTYDVGKMAWNFGEVAVGTIEIAKTVRGVKNVAEFIQADYYAVNGAMTGAATHASRPAATGASILEKIGVKGLQTGGKLAGAISGVLNVVGIAFGIMDVVDGANSINNGSDLAKEFFKTANELEAWMLNLCEFDEKLQM